MSRRITHVGITVAAAFALVAIIASSAAAAENESCTTNVLCTIRGSALRDDFTSTTPASTEARYTVEGETEKRKVEGGFGMDIEARNELGYLNFTFKKTGSESLVWKSPQSNTLLGIKLDHDETSSTTECHRASGWATFVRIGLGGEEAWYAGEAPYKPKQGRGGLGPWPVTFYSAKSSCGAKAGEVVVENVATYTPVLVRMTGTLTGKWVQPKTEGACPGGGIRLNTAQPGLISKTFEVEERTVETTGYLCLGRVTWED